MSEYRLEIKQVSKSFGTLKANDKIDLKIKPSSIHAFLGENGAGKSTLMNIIYGLIRQDEGEIYFEGKQVKINSPKKARALGIGIVFQHFALFDALSVVENIALGIDYQGSTSDLAHKINDLCSHYNLSVNPHAIIETLSTGEKQRVEILRCLLQNPRVLILDEPTSVLTPVEVAHLFSTLRLLKQEGCSILFISHKLEEVKQLCDEATIVRRGKLIGACFLANTDISAIAQMMVGKLITQSASRDTNTKQTPLLTYNAPYLKNELVLKTGTITAIAGIAGNGQDELLASLCGEISSPQECIIFAKENITHQDNIQRRKKGILFVPTERLGRSAVEEMSLLENALLAVKDTKRFTKNTAVDYNALRDFSEQIIEQYNVQAKGPQDLASSLSGGNLQKFVIGRTLLQEPQVLLISNPTWGVDIDSAMFIRNKLIALRDKGVCILVASEDLDELFVLGDEIAVMSNKQLSNITPIHSTTKEQIGQMMTRGTL